MTKTSTTRVHNRKTVNLRKKLLCVMAVSAASLLSSSALANTETISVPQIVNETTLQDVGKHLASYNEFFLTELGAIWVDGVQLDLSNIKLTGNHVRPTLAADSGFFHLEARIHRAFQNFKIYVGVATTFVSGKCSFLLKAEGASTRLRASKLNNADIRSNKPAS